VEYFHIVWKIIPCFNYTKDFIDKALEKAGYKFVRYADDFVVMTKDKRGTPCRP